MSSSQPSDSSRPLSSSCGWTDAVGRGRREGGKECKEMGVGGEECKEIGAEGKECKEMGGEGKECKEMGGEGKECERGGEGM